MSNNRQKSFIASLELDDEYLEFLGNLYEDPVTRHSTFFSGGFYTGASSKIDDSHLLGIKPREPSLKIAPLNIYFRCAEDYYTLQILSPGTHTDKCVSKDNSGVLGAFPPAGSDTTSFNLLNLQDSIVTLDDLRADTHQIRLKARNAGQISSIRRQGAPYVYLADIKRRGLIFNLCITERNVPYANDPDDI